MTLPTEKTEINRNWNDQKLLIIGQGGIGKSGLMAEAEGNLFLDTDHNVGHLKVLKKELWGWDDVREVIGELILLAEKDEPFPYTSITVDTIDEWVNFCEEDVVQRGRLKYTKNDIYTIGDIPEGNGWRATTKSVMTSLRKLAHLPCGLILIGHVKTTTVKKPTLTYDKETISLTAGLGAEVLKFVNHTLQIQATPRGNDLVRDVFTLPSKDRESKSHGGMIPNGWQMVEDMHVNWTSVRNLFEPKLTEESK